MPPELLSAIVAAPMESRSAVQRIAEALALEKDDPLRMEHDLWQAARALSVEEVRGFPADFASFAKLAAQVNSIGGAE